MYFQKAPPIPADNTTRAKAAIEAFFLLLVFKLVQTGFEVHQAFFVSPEEKRQAAYDAARHGTKLMTLENVMGAIGVGLIIYTVIMFILWMARGYKNLDRVYVRGLPFPPGMAVGGLFIPLYNFYVLYKAPQQIWLHTAKLTAPEGVEVKKSASPVPEWWFFWMIASFLPLVALWITFRKSTVLYSSNAARDIEIVMLIASGCRLISLYLAIRMIRRTSALERKLLAKAKTWAEANNIPVVSE